MARNALGVVTDGPRTNLTQADLDWIYGRDGATGGTGAVTFGGPVPDLTPRPQLRGSIDETAPALRGTLGPKDSMGGRNTAVQGPSIPTASGAPLPVGKGFAQAVYERALGTGMTDTQARLVASQAALESRHGRSGLARNDNNFFGIKAGSSWKGPSSAWGTGEQAADGSSYRETARFRKYATPEDSFADYVSLVKRKWPEAFAADNIRDAAAGLRFGQQGGYATDQAYGSKIESIARGLKPPGQPGPFNPEGIRPPADIPYANPVRNNLSPTDQARVNGGAPPVNDLVDRHQLQGVDPRQYEFRQPYRPVEPPQRVQDYLMPAQQPVQGFQPVQQSQNAFGGGGDDLISFLGLGGDMGGWG